MEPKKNFKIVPPRNPRVLLPNIFTLVGVCIGLTSIKFAFDGRFEMAVIAIIVAGIIDGLDGRIARYRDVCSGWPWCAGFDDVILEQDG